MILIADSGSTKTDWIVCDNTIVVNEIHTRGINPVHESEEEILKTVTEELVPQMNGIQPEKIYFYGAGCAYSEANNRVIKALEQCFGQSPAFIASDLLGAARALCNGKEGITCILGTGSNSCLYDGEKIIDQISPLGYILGDEGSAAVLGRSLLSDCLKRQLPPAICEKFFKTYELDTATILEKVYRQPLPNRFLGSLAPFLDEYRSIPEIHQLLMRNFNEFYTRNVMAYHHPWLPIHMVGSIAFQFSNELKEAADGLGLRLGTIVQSPLPGLVKYHQ